MRINITRKVICKYLLAAIAFEIYTFSYKNSILMHNYAYCLSRSMKSYKNVDHKTESKEEAQLFSQVLRILVCVSSLLFLLRFQYVQVSNRQTHTLTRKIIENRKY